MSNALSTARYGRVDPGPGWGTQYDLTTNTTLTAAMDGGLVTNAGAVATFTATLPVAVRGMEFSFSDVAGFPIIVAANAADKISGVTGGRAVVRGARVITFVCLADSEWTIASWHEQKTSVAEYGATGDGTTDDTVAWEAAMANGGTIVIPEGDYLLNDCDIPANLGDITLKPLGQVTIKANSSASTALNFNCTGNLGDSVAVTAVADHSDYPTTFDQLLTKITGTFTGYSVDDVCQISSDDITYDGFIKGEMFRVLFVAADDTYIITDRHLFYSYTPGSNTTAVVRATATPRLTIERGITFDCQDDPTGAIGTRGFNLKLSSAIEPQIDVRLTNSYTTGIRMGGCYKGRVRLESDGVLSDYSKNAFGYGVELRGPCYGTVLDLHGRGGGHIVVMNGDLTTYTPASPDRMGVPQDPVVKNAIVSNARAGGVDSHWSIRPKFQNIVVDAAVMPDALAPGSPFGLIIGAVDPWFGNVSVRDCHGFMTLRACKGVATRYSFEHVDYRTTGQGTFTAPLIASENQTTVQPVIDIKTGFIDTIGKAALAATESVTIGYQLILGAVTFGPGCSQLALYSGSVPMDVDLLDCILLAGANMTQGLVRYNVDTADRFRIWGLKVVASSGGYPNGIAYVAAGITASTVIDRLVMPATKGLPKLSSGTHTITSMSVQQGATTTYFRTTSAAATLAADTTYTFRVGDVIRYTDPAASGNVGQICTTAGAGGTAVFKTFGAIAA